MKIDTDRLKIKFLCRLCKLFFFFPPGLQAEGKAPRCVLVICTHQVLHQQYKIPAPLPDRIACTAPPSPLAFLRAPFEAAYQPEALSPAELWSHQFQEQ